MTVFKKGQKPYEIDEQVKLKLDQLKINKLQLISNLSENDYEAIRTIAPKIDKISKNVSLISVWNLLSIKEFESYQDSCKKDKIDLQDKNDIFCTNGDIVSVLKGFPGIAKVANIANIQVAYANAPLEETEKPLLKDILKYDRFIDLLFGRFIVPQGGPKELENQALKWFETYKNTGKISFSTLNINLKGKLGKSYSRFIKYAIQTNLKGFFEIITKVIADTKLSRFIYEKFHNDKVPVVPCTKISFSLTAKISVAMKNRLDIERIEKTQSKISEIPDYEEAKKAQQRLIQSITVHNSTLLKALIKRGNVKLIYNDKGKVIKTLNDILEKNNEAWLHAKAIELYTLPYDEVYINSIIPGMKLREERFSIDEKFLIKLPQNILDDVTACLNIEKIKSSVQGEAKKINFNPFDEDKILQSEFGEDPNKK